MPQNLRNYNGSPQAKNGSPVCLSHSLKLDAILSWFICACANHHVVLLTYKFLAPITNGHVPRLTRGDETTLQPPPSVQDVKVEVGTKASHA